MMKKLVVWGIILLPAVWGYVVSFLPESLKDEEKTMKPPSIKRIEEDAHKARSLDFWGRPDVEVPENPLDGENEEGDEET